MNPTKPSAGRPVVGLLIDVTGSRSAKLFDLLEQLGITLVPRSTADSSLYQLVATLKPDIIFTDVNSSARDTLEHVVNGSDDMPQAVVSADGDLRTSLGRLAGDIGISLYASRALSPSLLQALIDVTISHCHSIEVLRREVVAMRGGIDEDAVAVVH